MYHCIIVKYIVKYMYATEVMLCAFRGVPGLCHFLCNTFVCGHIYIYIYIYIYTIPGRQLLYMPSSMDTWAVASTKRPDMLRIRRQRSLITKCQGTHACVAAVR